jgi:hypothetical protein
VNPGRQVQVNEIENGNWVEEAVEFVEEDV